MDKRKTGRGRRRSGSKRGKRRKSVAIMIILGNQRSGRETGAENELSAPGPEEQGKRERERVGETLMTRKEERKNTTKDKADEHPTRQTGLRRTQRKALLTRETKKKGRKGSKKNKKINKKHEKIERQSRRAPHQRQTGLRRT